MVPFDVAYGGLSWEKSRKEEMEVRGGSRRNPEDTVCQGRHQWIALEERKSLEPVIWVHFCAVMMHKKSDIYLSKPITTFYYLQFILTSSSQLQYYTSFLSFFTVSPPQAHTINSIFKMVQWFLNSPKYIIPYENHFRNYLTNSSFNL